MADIDKSSYSALDRREINMCLFHPRPEPRTASKKSSQDVLIPVEDNIVIGARFHMAEKSATSILFFHGNGEIVADYDELSTVYNRMGINFIPADYRGYGRSTGNPTISAMMRDCHVILEFTEKWLITNGYDGPLIIMGRSLGSASALELADSHRDRLSGLIIESGFAHAGPLLRLLGIDVEGMGFKEEQGFRNVDKISYVDKPTLIIHAEMDHIIPYSEGEALFRACGSHDKTLLKIPKAGHNDIFIRGMSDYMSAVRKLAEKLRTVTLKRKDI